MRSWAALSPRWSSISAPAQTAAMGFAMPRPAMSGADPWIGSNIDGAAPLGIEVGAGGEAEAAREGGPEVGQDVAEQVGPDDDVEGLRMVTMRAASASMWYLRTVTSG